MKTKFLLFTLLFLPCLVKAQDTYTFNYDYLQKRIISYQKKGAPKSTPIDNDGELRKLILNNGDIVIVQIDNINTYAYSIAVTVQSQSFNQTPPPLLASLFTDFNPSALAVAPPAARPGYVAPPPAYPQSTTLATDIQKVVTARREFYMRSLALTYRKFDANTAATAPDIQAVQNSTPATLLTDYKAALVLMDKVQSDYLAGKASNTTVDDKTLLDNLYKGYSDKDYPTAFEAYLKEQLNISKSDFEYTTPPVTVKGEKVAIVIAIGAIASNTAQQSAAGYTAVSREYDLKVQALWHWSFSTGFFMSSLGSKTYISRPNTHTNSTVTPPVDTVTGYQNVLDNNTKLVFGATALLHYTYKITPGFELGGHVGLGVPINTSFNMNYLAGGTVFLFNDNRLGINFGLAAGYTPQLSPNVSTSVVYKNATDVPISYVDKFRADRFEISITYNLSDLFGGSSTTTPAGAATPAAAATPASKGP